MFVLRAFGLSGAPIPATKSQFQHLPIRIGRNPLNDYVMGFTMISNFHARIEDNNGQLCVCDLGSKNGIYLQSPNGGKPVRLQPNTSVALDPANQCFFLSEHIQVRVDVVAQQAPVRDALACGTVLGNLSIISVSGSQPPQAHLASAPQLQAVHSNSSPPPAGRPSDSSEVRDFGRQRLGHEQGAGNQPPHGAAPAQPSPDRGWHSGPQAGAATQGFQMDLQTLALLGLREMAGSLIPQRQLETSGDIARFITKLHDAMDVFCRTFIPLRQGYAEFVASLDLQRAASGRCAHVAPSTVALTQARTPEAIAMALLDPQDRSFDGPAAIEGILADLMIHQVALLDGVMEGVRSLLDELSPQSIEQAIGSGGAAGLLGSKYKSRWEEFCRRFEKLSEGQQAFSYVFGQDFAEVYRQYWHRKAGSEDGGLRTERPPG